MLDEITSEMLKQMLAGLNIRLADYQIVLCNAHKEEIERRIRLNECQ